jgi:hypothetical protein
VLGVVGVHRVLRPVGVLLLAALVVVPVVVVSVLTVVVLVAVVALAVVHVLGGAFLDWCRWHRLILHVLPVVVGT